MRRVVPAAAALLCLAACSTDTVSAPSSPITPGGTISGWAAPTASTVVAVDAVTGRIRWQTKAPTRSVAFGGVGGGTVIISGFSDCHGRKVTVTALDSATGVGRWQKRVAMGDRCTPAAIRATLVGSTVIAGGTGNDTNIGAGCSAGNGPRIVALDASTGSLKWTGSKPTARVLAATPTTVIAAQQGGCLVALDTATGMTRRRARPNDPSYDAAASGDVLIRDLVNPSNIIQRMDPRSGRPSWTANLPAAGGSSAPLLGTVAIVKRESVQTAQYPYSTVLIAYEPGTGHELWMHASHGQTMAFPSLGGGLLIVAWVPPIGTADIDPGAVIEPGPYVDARNPRTGTVLWTTKDYDGAPVGAYTDGRTVLVETDQGVTALNPLNGKRLWSTRGTFAPPAFDGSTIYLTTTKTPKHSQHGN